MKNFIMFLLTNKKHIKYNGQEVETFPSQGE